MTNEKGVVLIEFADGSGYEKLTGGRGGDPVERSQKAVSRAMETISLLADQVKDTFVKLAAAPDQAEVEFSLTFKGEAGALIAKTTAEGALKVKLTWKKAG